MSLYTPQNTTRLLSFIASIFSDALARLSLAMAFCECSDLSGPIFKISLQLTNSLPMTEVEAFSSL